MLMCLIRMKQEASGKELKLFLKLSMYEKGVTCTHVGVRYLQATPQKVYVAGS
jgi:hypothetical protein